MDSGKYQYQSDFARNYVKGQLEGKAEGKAEGWVEAAVAALHAVLDARALEVPAEARARIVACTDHGKLELWLRRAATARTADEVFAATESPAASSRVATRLLRGR